MKVVLAVLCAVVVLSSPVSAKKCDAEVCKALLPEIYSSLPAADQKNRDKLESHMLKQCEKIQKVTGPKQSMCYELITMTREISTNILKGLPYDSV